MPHVGYGVAFFVHCFGVLVLTRTPFSLMREKQMPIPAYMWIKHDGGADVKGSSTVQGRGEASKFLIAISNSRIRGMSADKWGNGDGLSW
ncbi:hypothetical protein PSAC2689_130029 [Paraburkholderia sacchari]